MDEAQYRLEREAEEVVRLGKMLLGSGTGGYRILRAMKRAARGLGFESLDADVGITSITATFRRGDVTHTIVSSLDKPPAVNASRIEAIEAIAHRELHRRVTLDEIKSMLDHIERHVTHRWGRAVSSTAAGVACFGFALLNFFPFWTALAVAVSAAIGQLVRMALGSKGINQLGVVALSGVTTSLVYYAIETVLGTQSVIASGFVAAVLYLIPGFPLYSSMLDLSRFDFSAGIPRLFYAFEIIVVATFSVSAFSILIGLAPTEPATVERTLSWFVMAAGASFAGIGGFAILFNSSRRMALTAAVIGTFANLVRLALLEHGTVGYFAAFVGGVTVGWLGAFLAPRLRIPRITLTVPAAVIMIPGSAMFRAVYAVSVNEINDALTNGFTAAVTVLFIGAGLTVARMTTDRDWALGRPIDFNRQLDDF